MLQSLLGIDLDIAWVHSEELETASTDSGSVAKNAGI